MKYLRAIWIVSKKELKGYFDHPVAYLILVVFLAINAFFFFRTAFVYNIADLRSMFSNFLWLFLFIAPAITMRLVAEEKQRHTLELLFTQPVREWQILLGKWLGGVLFITIGLILTLAIPMFLSGYGNFDWGTIAAQYLGAFFFAWVAVAIGILASSVTRNQIVSFILAIAIVFLMVIIGYSLVTMSLPSSVKTVFEQLSVSWHYTNIIRGVVDLRDFIYFVTATASFLAVSYWLMIRGSINPKRSIWRQLKIGIAVLIGIAVVINLLGLNIHGRWDLTKQQLYTLSDATRNIISDLPDIVNIDVYQSQELPPEVSVRSRDVADLLTDYEVGSNGNINVNYHYIDADNASEAEQAGIQPVQFNVLKSDEFQVKRGYFGLAISYADEKETIPFIESSDDFEYRITSAVRKLTSESGYTIGFLSGHGEKSLFSDYATIARELNKQYQAVTVTIDADAGALSEEVDVLVVAGPQEAMTAEEKKVIRDFVNGGGKAMFLIDSVIIDMQTLQTTPNENSLADLVEEFGIRVNADIVGDLRSHESISMGGGMFNYVLPYPFWPRTVATDDNPITGDLETVLMPWTSSVTSVADEKRAISLLETTDAGFAQSSPFNLYPDQDISVPPGQRTTKTVAMAMTNPQSADASVNDVRLVVFGDSDFLTDNFLANNAQAAIMALNAIDWLVQDESLISVRSKQRQAATLIFAEDSQKNTVKYINVVGMPLLVAVAGALHIYRRRKITRKQYRL